ncbi:MAG: hypothetical protein ACOYN4_15395 [Bacteroidales bacterium]
MPKSVTFSDLATPTSLSAVAVAGGTLLPNTTYYYVVVAVFTVGTSPRNMDGGKSLASNEISVTTTSVNLSVSLTFNHPKGAGGGYRIYRATAPGMYGTCLNIAPLDSAINIGGACSYIDTGVSPSGNNSFQNTSHGKLTLLGSTSADAFSIIDLYAASMAAGWGVVTKLDQSTYRVDAYIIGHSGIYWVDEEKTIIFADGFFAGSASNYRFGRITGLITNRGCRLIFKAYHLTDFTPVTLNAFKTTFDWVLDYSPVYNSYSGLSYFSILFNAGTVQDCQSNKLRSFSPLSAANCTLKNFVCTEYDIGFSTGQATFLNVTGMAGSRPFQTSTNTVMRAKDLVSVGNTYTILTLGTNAQITLVNTNGPAASFVALSDSTGTVVNELFTYNLTVYKNDGVTVVVGAAVKVYDAFGNLLVNRVTGGNGAIAEQELIFRKQTFVGTVRTSTDYTPHKLEVSMPGYETYSCFTAYSGANATFHVVALKAIVISRPTIEGKILIATNPQAGSSSKLLEV